MKYFIYVLLLLSTTTAAIAEEQTNTTTLQVGVTIVAPIDQCTDCQTTTSTETAVTPDGTTQTTVNKTISW